MEDGGLVTGTSRLVDWWRRFTFGPPAETPYRRRTSDWIRVGVAAALLFVAARHADDPTATERTIIEFFKSLPVGLVPLWETFYRFGALWAVGLVVTTALVGRRWRLARDVLLCGLVAWGLGRFIGEIVEGSSLTRSLGAVPQFAAGPAFPAVRIAVLVAVTSAARPYVTRPVRRIGRVLVVGLAAAALYLGNASPNDVFGGIVLGWGIAASVHLVFGSPAGRPTAAQVARSLVELGVDARDVRLASPQPTGSTLLLAADADGPLRIKVIGRDEADAQFLTKVYRFVAYKDSGPRLWLTRLQQLEYEAYVMLMARDGGVRLPRVVRVGKAGPGAALLVQRTIEGDLLTDLESSAVDDSLLEQVWDQLGVLHAAHVVHGRLDADHVVVGPDGPAFVGFARASTSSAPEHSAADVAELLATTAAVAGDERAIRAALSVVPPGEFRAALAFLQPAAVTRRTRQLAGPHRRQLNQRLEHLRERGATAIDTQPPEVIQLHRISGPSLALAIGTLVAAGVLLAEVGDPSQVSDTFRHAQWGWIAVALTFSFASNVAYAVALQGTVLVRLPLWRTTELQIAMSFSNLAVPGVGGLAMQVRYLQKQGIDLSSAVAAGGLLSTVGNLAAAFGLFALAVLIAPSQLDFGQLATSDLAEFALGVIAAVCVTAGLIVGVPRLRRAAIPPVQRAASTIWASLRSPRLLALLLGGNVLAALLSVWCMAACVAAFDGHASFWAVLAAYIGVVTIAAIVPIPGGGTAVSSVGLSGALVALGIPEDVAIAAVLANQLIYNYLPAVPGWFATRNLMRHDYL